MSEFEPCHPLKYRDVLVEWVPYSPGEQGWRRYQVRHVVGNLICLRGRDDLDGTRFEGGDIWVPLVHILSLELDDESHE